MKEEQNRKKKTLSVGSPLLYVIGSSGSSRQCGALQWLEAPDTPSRGVYEESHPIGEPHFTHSQHGATHPAGCSAGLHLRAGRRGRGLALPPLAKPMVPPMAETHTWSEDPHTRLYLRQTTLPVRHLQLLTSLVPFPSPRQKGRPHPIYLMAF
ncbi:uncharacterized protein LOC123508719 [Portunus trituberculatus]|uniref:uncharacterized protein LOC123508719 n=1 Tax=Portunus trituberculatus TaxID=210409 RepID=UPI001E1D1D55|nr:uncharacterized protein LOC123508719 [Portunus trituberculatus]